MNQENLLVNILLVTKRILLVTKRYFLVKLLAEIISLQKNSPGDQEIYLGETSPCDQQKSFGKTSGDQYIFLCFFLPGEYLFLTKNDFLVNMKADLNQPP